MFCFCMIVNWLCCLSCCPVSHLSLIHFLWLLCSAGQVCALGWRPCLRAHAASTTRGACCCRWDSRAWQGTVIVIPTPLYFTCWTSWVSQFYALQQAVETLQQLAKDHSTAQLEQYFCPMIKRLAAGVWIFCLYAYIYICVCVCVCVSVCVCVIRALVNIRSWW